MFRFGLPPSLGPADAKERAVRLQAFFEKVLGAPAEISVGKSYDALAKDLLAGRVDAAWAPPFVCARLEAMGVKVLVRGVRQGASVYRAALVTRANRPLTPERLSGLTAIWVDPNSVGGYLLAAAFLRARRIEPARTFFAQSFAGSYRAALEAVLEGRADVTSIYAPSGGQQSTRGADEALPGASSRLSLVALTDESPNDGVAVSMSAHPEQVAQLEQALLAMGKEARDLFNLDKFEAAPRMGYRALYRVALSSL